MHQEQCTYINTYIKALSKIVSHSELTTLRIGIKVSNIGLHQPAFLRVLVDYFADTIAASHRGWPAALFRPTLVRLPVLQHNMLIALVHCYVGLALRVVANRHVERLRAHRDGGAFVVRDSPVATGAARVGISFEREAETLRLVTDNLGAGLLIIDALTYGARVWTPFRAERSEMNATSIEAITIFAGRAALAFADLRVGAERCRALVWVARDVDCCCECQRRSEGQENRSDTLHPDRSRRKYKYPGVNPASLL